MIRIYNVEDQKLEAINVMNLECLYFRRSQHAEKAVIKGGKPNSFISRRGILLLIFIMSTTTKVQTF